MLNIEIPSFKENIKSDDGSVTSTDLFKLFNGEYCHYAILKNPGRNGKFSGTKFSGTKYPGEIYHYDHFADLSSYEYGLRFSINYDELMKYASEHNLDLNIVNKRNMQYIYFGSFIDDSVSLETKTILDEKYDSGGLNKTGNIYHLICNDFIDKKQTVDIEEYELNGDFFVRIESESISPSIKLSNGNYVYRGGIYWLKIKPVKWIINQNENVVVSEKILVPFVLEDKSNSYYGDFGKTDMKKYIDTYFQKELLYHPQLIYSVSKGSKNQSKINFLKHLKRVLLKTSSASMTNNQSNNLSSCNKSK